MNSVIGSETLKLHFGTLFLRTYRLPSFGEVKEVIDEAKSSYFGQSCYFISALQKLHKILSEVEKRKDELMSLSTGRFLRNFNDHLLRCGLLVLPSSKDGSCKRFFRMFLDPAFLPDKESDLQLIYEWIMFVVQFEEADETHTKFALKLLAELKNYVENLIEEFMKRRMRREKRREKRGVDEVDRKVDLDDDEDDVDIHDDLLNYRDIKFCHCLEYEVSEDCCCAFDL